VNSKLAKLLQLLGTFQAGMPGVVFACATCYGASDSALAQGMNWGIGVLLGVILSVLVGVASFFVYLVRRANAMAAPDAAAAVSTDLKS
jgi:hypothetical protein